MKQYFKVNTWHPQAQDMLDHLINCRDCVIIAYFDSAVLLECTIQPQLDMKV